MDPKMALLALLLIALPDGLVSHVWNKDVLTEIQTITIETGIQGDIQSTGRAGASSSTSSTPPVHLDLSSDICMGDVKDAGDISHLHGAGYALASMPIFEWAYCKYSNEKEFKKFSEQYVIDCGELLGKRGNSIESVEDFGKFVINFGLQLQESYPFSGQKNDCRLTADIILKTIGNYRVSAHVIKIPMAHWSEYLQSGPLVVELSIAQTQRSGFEGYQQGVIDFSPGFKNQIYVLTIVGEGIVQGIKYWKLRYYRGSDWGERGYIKIHKSSTCLGDYAYSYGTQENGSFSLRPSANLDYFAAPHLISSYY